MEDDQQRSRAVSVVIAVTALLSTVASVALGEVAMKMRIEPDGKVAWTAAKVSSSPFQSCLDRLFKKARMPRSAKGATITQTVQLP